MSVLAQVCLSSSLSNPKTYLVSSVQRCRSRYVFPANQCKVDMTRTWAAPKEKSHTLVSFLGDVTALPFGLADSFPPTRHRGHLQAGEVHSYSALPTIRYSPILTGSVKSPNALAVHHSLPSPPSPTNIQPQWTPTPPKRTSPTPAPSTAR